jgi:UDP-2,3-diacylglucosamine hydrolase
MATYFISDLHLHPQREAITAAFFAFTERLAAGDQLFILGDFFDAWLGDDDDHPLAVQVQAHLKALVDRQVTTALQVGNRDFLLGARFAAATGVELLPDVLCRTIEGHAVLLLHGDSLCTADTAYMAFRQQVRSPAWQQQVLSLPLPQRRQMAAELRAKSQSLNAMKADDIMDVTAEEVDRIMLQHQVKRLIHGHTHRPQVHQWQLEGETVERLVLGDWDTHLWYILAQNGAFALVQEPLPSASSLPTASF